MTNIIEAVSSIFSTFLDDDPKPLINVGEVTDLWKYLVFIEDLIIVEQIGKNMSTDTELLELLHEAISICKAQSDRIKKVMHTEGIALPSLPEDKPHSKPDAVPNGAKLTDEEIATILAAKLLLASRESSRSMTEAIRTDLGAMWGNFLFEQAKFGAKLKTTMRKRGWLKVPPAYNSPGVPEQSGQT